jgi:hypothetical protein
MSRPFADWRLIVERRGDDEWIVRSATGGRHLHIYRVGDHDWLVSEVSRKKAGRGGQLTLALAALAGDETGPGWWQEVPAALRLELEEDE